MAIDGHHVAIMAITGNPMAINGHYDCHNGDNGHYFLTIVNVRSVRKVHTIHHPAALPQKMTCNHEGHMNIGPRRKEYVEGMEEKP